MKKTHKDCFGRAIHQGDYLVYPRQDARISYLGFARVVELRHDHILLVSSYIHYTGEHILCKKLVKIICVDRVLRVSASELPEKVKGILDQRWEKEQNKNENLLSEQQQSAGQSL